MTTLTIVTRSHTNTENMKLKCTVHLFYIAQAQYWIHLTLIYDLMLSHWNKLILQHVPAAITAGTSWSGILPKRYTVAVFSKGDEAEVTGLNGHSLAIGLTNRIERSDSLQTCAALSRVCLTQRAKPRQHPPHGKLQEVIVAGDSCSVNLA